MMEARAVPMVAAAKIDTRRESGGTAEIQRCCAELQVALLYGSQ
jgi:hypothetical protein